MRLRSIPPATPVLGAPCRPGGLLTRLRCRALPHLLRRTSLALRNHALLTCLRRTRLPLRSSTLLTHLPLTNLRRTCALLPDGALLTRLRRTRSFLWSRTLPQNGRLLRPRFRRARLPLDLLPLPYRSLPFH